MEFRKHRLDNGLEIIAETNGDAHSMSVAFIVRTGSRDESDEVAGVSHFLEHMCFKGTPRRSADDVNREFDEIGAHYKAFTSEECTAYRDCGLSACESEYEECLGPNAASGDYSGGVCDGFFECLGDCQSGDTCDIFCVADCAEADEACQTCLSTMDECGSEACPDEAEECDGSRTTSTTTGSTTGGGATGTCMDLEDCCNSLEGEDKTGCLDTLEQASAGGDQACAILLSIYQTGGQCPT